MSLRPNSRTQIRRNRYKVAVDADEARRRREDNMVEIRKSKREESLLKKRRQAFDPPQPIFPVKTTFIENKVESLPSMVNKIWSMDSNMQLDATTQFRKLLSKGRNPPIEEVIQSGVVPRFVEFLKRADSPQLQFEAAWALTNIASGTSENTKVVMNHGAVPIFVQLLGSPSDNVREQAVWALGNIAGDSPQCRDHVLSDGALMPLLAQLNEHSKLSMLRNAVWTLSNFFRGKPQPPFELMRPALPVLQSLLYSNDEEVLTDACWAFSYLSDGTNDRIQAVIEAGVCQRLVELLLHPSPTILSAALRAVGNIATGADAQTQLTGYVRSMKVIELISHRFRSSKECSHHKRRPRYGSTKCIIDNGALPRLRSLLTHNHKKGMKKEACWTISNITAGNKGQIQAVIQAGLIGPIISLLQTAESDVKKEAAWAISNLTSCGTDDQIKYLVKENCIKPLCDLLVFPDPGIVAVCLEGLDNILKVGEAEKKVGNSEVNYYARMIDEAEGLEKIENLQSHDNNDIYQKAVKILETYWLDEEDDLLPPSVGVANTYVPSGGFDFS